MRIFSISSTFPIIAAGPGPSDTQGLLRASPREWEKPSMSTPTLQMRSRRQREAQYLLKLLLLIGRKA